MRLSGVSGFRGAPVSARGVATVWGAAVALRLGYLALAFAVAGGDGVMAEDSFGLLATARDFAAGRTALGFDGTANYDGGLMPLPVFILAAISGVGAGPLGFLLLQVVLDGATCVLIGLMAASVRAHWFLVAGLLAAVNPTQIVLAGMVLTDSLFLLFSTGALLLLVRAAVPGSSGADGRPAVGHSVRNAAIFGGLLGLAALTRSAIVPWLPVGLGLYWVLTARRFGAIRGGGRTVLAGTLALLLVLPIGYRTQQTHGEWALTHQGGDHLLFWVVPLVGNLGAGEPRAALEESARARLDARFGEVNADDTVARNEVAQALAREMLWEFGPAAILRAWTAGAALNLGLPATAVSPPVRSLPHESFYDTPGDGAVDKILAFALAEENRLYVVVNAAAAAGVAIWLALLPVGLWRIGRAAPCVLLVLGLWCGYILALNGPIASPKYRLPIEPVWVVAVAAAMSARARREAG